MSTRVGSTVIAATARALKAAHLPPMDERLKSIVGRQILTLHKGGWPIEEIERAVIDLALAWDETRGHNRLTHLAKRMHVMDADRKRREHVAQMAIGKGNAQELRALLGDKLIAGKPHPSTHDYQRGGEVPGLCAICEGPSGVHERLRVETA